MEATIMGLYRVQGKINVSILLVIWTVSRYNEGNLGSTRECRDYTGIPGRTMNRFA